MLRAALFATAALIAAPALAQSALTGDQIRGLVSGATIEGAMEGSGPYAEFYAPDGTIRGADYTGAWSVQGDTMCFQYGDGAPSCWSVVGSGSSVQWLQDGAVLGTGTVTAGNPNNF